MKIKFPKPILFYDDDQPSFYNDDIEFSFEIIDRKIENGFINIDFNYTLNSNMLIEKLDSGEASLFIKVQTDLKSFFHKIDHREETKTIDVDLNQLKRTDKIRFQLFIICNKTLELKWCDEFNSNFEKDYVFDYKKGDLLAISNSEILHYSLSGSPFISLSLAEQQNNKGLLFSIEGTNTIQIKVGEDFNNAFAKLNKEPKTKDLINAFLIHEAILYAINKIVESDDGIEKNKNKEWFKALDYCFDDSKYNNFEEFLYIIKDNHDTNEIIRVSQKIINNQLELKVIDTGRRFR